MFNRIGVRNIVSFITSYNRLAIYHWGSSCVHRIYVACMLKKRRDTYMTVVVKKVPKFLRGFVKLIFGIKN